MSTPETVEINDGVFCKDHIREVCDDCTFDGREENDSFFGLDPIDREPVSIPSDIHNKDGVYHCKKHSSSTCNSCFGWKKQIVKLHKEAKKAGKSKGSGSNLY